MSESASTPRNLSPPSRTNNPFVQVSASEERQSPKVADTSQSRPQIYHPDSEQEYQGKPWKHYRRPTSPSLPWHKEYSQLDPKSGRVLVVDFFKADHSKNGRRKVVAQELVDLDGLRRLYRDQRRDEARLLRLFHVQNAQWASNFLSRKFNINNRDDLVGTDFGRYAQERKPRRRGGRPVLSGKTWRVQHDPWRGVSKTSFGFDYLKEYRMCGENQQSEDMDDKMMELNCLDEDDNPTFGFNVYTQRLAVYVQHKEASPTPPNNDTNGVSSPYRTPPNGVAKDQKHGHSLPQLNSLDNENAVLIFDCSHSKSFEDCLMPARSEWESHWRRLPFYLAYESPLNTTWANPNDDQLGLQCAKLILDDVFKALISSWDDLLDVCQTHVSILEDKVYDQPADETRAPELWSNSSLWLKVEKLAYTHLDVVKEMRTRLPDLSQDARPLAENISHPANAAAADDNDWLEEIPASFSHITNTVSEDLIKPTQNLISLVYQSVSIRDSRHSLALGHSMWRLSWVTFIFLPLTFIVGFFGMNVDVFSSDPSIKWYFIAAVPFMLCVLGLWYLMKRGTEGEGRTSGMRGVYENFFHDMSVEAPGLWTRAGPRNDVQVRGRTERWKWWIIKRWSRPEKTIRSTAGSDRPEDDLGQWSKMKRYLIHKWTHEVNAAKPRRDPDVEQRMLSDFHEGGLISGGLVGATEMLIVPGQPLASRVVEQNAQNHDEDVVELGSVLSVIKGERRLSPLRQAYAANLASDVATAATTFSAKVLDLQPPSLSSRRHSRRSSSGEHSQSSGLLVEEEDLRWINQQGREGKGWHWQGRTSGSAQGRVRDSSVGSGPGNVSLAVRRSSPAAPGERPKSPLGQDEGVLISSDEEDLER